MNAHVVRGARVGSGVLAGLGATVFGGVRCAERPSDAAVPPGERASPPPADSLVLVAPGGAEVWFTLARPDSGEGRHCVDRASEIRRAGARIPVPLLYTGGTPQIVNDTTLRARLSRGCRPGDSYLVDLRTGRPVREQP